MILSGRVGYVSVSALSMMKHSGWWQTPKISYLIILVLRGAA